MVNKSKHADLVDAIEFLATIQLKESATAYQQQDYLRLHSIRNSFGEKLASTCYEQTAMHSVACESRNSYEDRELAFTCFKQNMKYNVTWEMSSEGRRQVGQWFYRMTSCFGFPNEFAAIAMNYFDRVLSRSNPLPCSKSEIQLLALTCFYLSVKLFQAGPILSTEQICMISGYVYVPAEIVAMEQNILRKLEWCLYPPLPSEFLRPYLKILLCHANSPLPLYYDEILNLALEMMNALVFDYYFVAGQFPSSHVAVAAIVNAMLTVLPLSPEQPTIHEATRILSQLTGYKLDESAVFLCCKRLWGLMNKNCHQNWDLTMTPSYSSSCIRRDHRTGSPTPSSPIGVVASITILNDNEKAIYRPIEQSSAQSYNFFLS